MSPITLERPPLAGCILRVVRPTDQMDAVVAFYRDGLGFPELTRFADHDGFDGAILGFPARPITWSSPAPAAAPPAARRRPTTCWWSTCPTPAPGAG